VRREDHATSLVSDFRRAKTFKAPNQTPSRYWDRLGATDA
jgi:hypothetical protein